MFHTIMQYTQLKGVRRRKLEKKKCIAVEKEEMQRKVLRFRNATGKSKAKMRATEGPSKCTVV